MTSNQLKITDSLPPTVRIGVTVLAIAAKKRLQEQRRPRSKRKPPLVALLLSPHEPARAAAIAVVARHLGVPVQRVDWSRLLSPYLHEAELAVERLFHAAEHAGVLLLFDESDALFGTHGRPMDLDDAAYEACTEALLARLAHYDGPVCFTASNRRHLHPRVLALADPVLDLASAAAA